MIKKFWRYPVKCGIEENQCSQLVLVVHAIVIIRWNIDFVQSSSESLAFCSNQTQVSIFGKHYHIFTWRKHLRRSRKVGLKLLHSTQIVKENFQINLLPLWMCRNKKSYVVYLTLKTKLTIYYETLNDTNSQSFSRFCLDSKVK